MLPCVGVVYTTESIFSTEEAQLAQYVALCLAASGRCAKTYLVGMNIDTKNDTRRSKTTTSPAVARRCDGVLLDSKQLSSEIYEESDNWKILETCNMWLMLVETDATILVAEFLHEKLDSTQDKERPKRVVLSLQTTMRRLAQLNSAYV